MSELPSTELVQRLRDLAGEERGIQAAFLVHLEEFDRRRSFLDSGQASLWDWCLRVLHLSEGAAGRRIAAMRVVRRFPEIAEAVRDGRLNLSTAVLLGQVLTTENHRELVARAAYKSRAEVEQLVATLRPREAPKNGIRRLPSRASPSDARVGAHSRPGAGPPTLDAALATAPTPQRPSPVPPPVPAVTGSASAPASSLPASVLSPALHASAPASALSASSAPSPLPLELTPTGSASGGPRHGDHERGRAEVRPVSGEEWSIRVTVDNACKAGLDLLQELLSHKCGRDLASVLREAIRCGIEKHGKRRGAIPTRRPSPRTGNSSKHGHTNVSPKTDVSPEVVDERARESHRSIPAAIRQAVYDRDGGRCSFVAADGTRCGSKWKLEFDHIHSAFLDGPPTADNLRLLCRAHNIHHAEQVFGWEHMERFRQRYGVEGVG